MVSVLFCISVEPNQHLNYVCSSVYLTACEKINFPESLNEARASFLVNLAGVYSLRSEFDKARKCLQQVLHQNVESLSTPAQCVKVSSV